jgi:hypothetical protein
MFGGRAPKLFFYLSRKVDTDTLAARRARAARVAVRSAAYCGPLGSVSSGGATMRPVMTWPGVLAQRLMDASL